MTVALRYVITGCAASGTGWAYQCMSALGSPCGHQRRFGRFRPKHDREGESSWMAIGQIPHSVPVALLVRNPLRVVRSLNAELWPFLTDEDAAPHPQARSSTAYVRNVLPEIFDAPDRLGRILRYAASWDAGIEQLPRTHIMQIDNPPVDGERFAELYTALTGRNIGPRRCAGVLSQVGTSFNSHRGHISSLTWADIAAHPDGGPVIERAQRYGYPVG